MLMLIRKKDDKQPQPQQQQQQKTTPPDVKVCCGSIILPILADNKTQPIQQQVLDVLSSSHYDFQQSNRMEFRSVGLSGPDRQTDRQTDNNSWPSGPNFLQRPKFSPWYHDVDREG